jgi:hypothetical protein
MKSCKLWCLTFPIGDAGYFITLDEALAEQKRWSESPGLSVYRLTVQEVDAVVMDDGSYFTLNKVWPREN